MTVAIRLLADNDFDAYCRLIAEGDAFHHNALPTLIKHPKDSVPAKAAFLESVNNPAHLALCADVDGTVVGFVRAFLRQEAASRLYNARPFVIVEEIIVAESHHRSGVGKNLMSAVVDWSKTKGAQAIELNVYDFNNRAIKFYESLGYRPSFRRMALTL